MNKLKLHITDKAKNDINIITDYIAKDNIAAARRISVYLYNTCNTLACFPDLGTCNHNLTNTKLHLYVAQKRYIIAYHIQNNEIIVVRVLTNYQDICSLL